MTKKRGPKTKKANFASREIINVDDSLIFKNPPGKFDSISGDYFALVTPSVDRHRLRVFDRITGVLKNDFFSEKEDKFTCLTWGELSSGEEVNDEPGLSPTKPIKNNKPITSNRLKILALGLQNGSIAIYSLSHGKIISNLEGAHTMPINDFVFTRDGKRGFSCSDDLSIVEWNIEERSVVSKWKADSKVIKKLALSHSQSKLITTGYTIQLWDLQSKKVIRNYTGHASLINNIMFTESDNMCISAAEHDRYVNVWDCQENIKKFLIPLISGNKALIIDSNIMSVSISSKDILLVISEDGIMYLFDNSTVKNHSSSPDKKKNHSDTHSPTCVVKVLSEDKKEIIPILSAFFIEKKGNKLPSIVIARGSTVKPIFDIVDLDKERISKKSLSLPSEIKLMRSPQTGLLLEESNLVTANLKVTQKQYDESNVNILASSNIGLPKLSIANKLDETPPNKKSVSPEAINNITRTQTRSNKPTTIPKAGSEFARIDANSLQNVLIQALHSDDNAMLIKILHESKPDVIKNTVRKLPAEYVIPLIEKIVENFQTKLNPEIGILTWMKHVLLEHTAYLMTVPDLIKKLSNFYQVLETRLQEFNKLLTFHGRLEMIMQQISMRQQYAAERFSDGNAANSAKTIYVESEDDDDGEDDNDQNMETYENEGTTKNNMEVDTSESSDDDYQPSEEESDEQQDDEVDQNDSMHQDKDEDSKDMSSE
ncbi:8108_t:CDS:2 [Ambispora leptoticha]|uniref:8108_t:CDS:1 n=1 Tax=Ambispora leptoticha TaxID=144679 RepID=A0A9N8W985_9GLOM|nr:8108_t:CDS:2 [Ambispora leptoticha]